MKRIGDGYVRGGMAANAGRNGFHGFPPSECSDF
jgi:hypothetical protein